MRSIAAAAVLSFLFLPQGSASAQSGPPSDRGDRADVRSAMSAAPLSVTGDATLVGRPMPPSAEDGEARVLREGSNGWVCMPDNPDVPGDSPACVDEAWRSFLKAFLEGEEPPALQGIGISYMLRGDFPVSNRDPSATEPTPDNEWIEDSGPHVMLLVPDRSLLEGLPTSPGDGPWVMWAGTPYAHVMIPVPGMPRH
jgi:hypothetical protein